ncbi:S24 family peptidase [Bradyrhizobium sp. 13971]
MNTSMHHYGAATTKICTNPVHSLCTNSVPNPFSMKGKYPNGLEGAMARANLSSVKLAELAGTSRQQINKLASGEREMTAIWAERLAPLLKVPPENLVFPNLRRSRVPLISWVSAGRAFQQEGVRKSDVKKYITTADLPKGEWYALEVDGDSMNLIAPEGSYIFVNRADQNLVNEGFYVFTIGAGETTFKRYRAAERGRPARLQPYSTNPDHETMIPTEQTLVFGRVGLVLNDLITRR